MKAKFYNVSILSKLNKKILVSWRVKIYSDRVYRSKSDFRAILSELNKKECYHLVKLLTICFRFPICKIMKVILPLSKVIVRINELLHDKV